MITQQKRSEYLFSHWSFTFDFVYLFKGISIPYELFNATIWLISKYLITIIIIYIFTTALPTTLFYLSIHLHKIIWFQVFLSNTKDLYIYARIVQKTLSLTQILDLLHSSHVCMSLTCMEIKTEIWIGFSSFIRSGSVLP